MSFSKNQTHYKIGATLLFAIGTTCLLLMLYVRPLGQSTRGSGPQPEQRLVDKVIIEDEKTQQQLSSATTNEPVSVATNNEPTKTAVAASITRQFKTKAIDSHGSTILASKQYPQLRYHTLLAANDTLLQGSWYHSTIQSNRAWDLSTGSNTTVIAVIDSGFALNHLDLANKWKTNTAEQGNTASGGICWTGTSVSKTTNNCDDDNNGYIDDWRGWDFFSLDNDVQTGAVNPDGGGVSHGSMVSGVIAAQSNNAYGNAGIDWQAKIMPLQALSDDGYGYTYDIAAAVEYAVDNGADVINMSLGGGSFDQAMLDVITYATSQGVLVVAASGNCGNSTTDDCAGLPTGGMTYPARYADVISVGSTNQSDVRSGFSSFGPELDIVAPGDSIGPLIGWSSSLPTNGYFSSASGTSFASPIVAGIAGLLRAQMSNPSVAQLSQALLDSVDKVPAMNGLSRNNNYGFGRVNAHKATLMASAITNRTSLVGSSEIQGRQPPLGALTRSSSGSVANDEWVLISCRVDQVDLCSATSSLGSNIQRYNAVQTSKGSSVYNIYIRGSSLSNGSNILAVHSREFAASFGTISK